MTATITLFAALAGTSYAAATITGANIRNGTLTGADLKNGSVKGSDIDGGSLTGSDLKNGSVTSSDVADGSLLASDFKPGELPAGPAGPQGPGGLSDVVVRRTDTTVAGLSNAKAEAGCASGEIAVGGGGSHNGSVIENLAVVSSAPLMADGSRPEDGSRAARWEATLTSNVSASRVMSVYVLCTRP